MSKFEELYIIEIESFINEFYYDIYNKETNLLIINELTELFSDFVINTDRVGEIVVKIDWSPVVKYFEWHYETHFEFNNAKKSGSLENFFEKNDLDLYKFKIDCTMVSSRPYSDISDATSRYFKGVLNDFLYKLFIILNLSIPGYFRLRTKIVDDEENILSAKLYEDIFYRAFMDSKERNWPPIVRLPIKQVLNWYENLKIDSKVLSTTSTERAIFAIMHLCNAFRENVSTFLWLAHALEAIYDTPKITISKILKERIFIFIGDRKNHKSISKQIEKFYNIRSRFVHGEFEINHPEADPLYDEDYENYMDDLFDSYDFAFSIVVSSLQKLIINDWIEAKFYETFEGITIGHNN